MTDILAWLALDWANYVLVAAALVFVGVFVFLSFVPVFVGAASGDESVHSVAVMAGAMVSSPFFAGWVLIWIGRGAIGIVRWLVCPC